MSDDALPPTGTAGTPGTTTPGTPARDRWTLILIAVGATLLACLLLGLGPLALPSLAVIAIAGLALIVTRPEWLMVVAGAMLSLPGKKSVFPHEFVLGLLVFLTIVDGLRRRDRTLLRLDPVEIANGLFVVWALFTVFWSTDVRIYMHGVRRLLEGVAAFWVAYRLARVVPRRTFELSLLAISFGLGASSMAKYLHETGFMQRKVDRGTATDLGWGKSNTIATMLLLLGPLILDMAFRARSRLVRALAWCSTGFNGFMQLIIASRAATVLYFAGLYAQLTVGRKRSWVPALVITVLLAIAVISPSGQKVTSRFTDIREMGAMVVRIWYAREAWRRTIEGFPFGIGLNQGFVHPDKLNSMGTHDYWLDISSELGVIGIVLWISFLIVLARRIRSVTRTPGWLWEGRALWIAFWLSFLHTIVEPTFQVAHYQFVFFWAMGGYLGYHAIGATREAEERRFAPAGARPAGTADQPAV